jgi:tubulin polyglutamylase TTLL4
LVFLPDIYLFIFSLPLQLARGAGIKVVNKWNQIPKNVPLIVQRYIAKPHLINGTKYDLRIYVLMTSLHPLRIYLYDEGLVRFASNKYATDNASLSDVYMHLTNYSINKNNASYTPNEDPDVRQGHKWTLASLWQYFAETGLVDSKVERHSLSKALNLTLLAFPENYIKNLGGIKQGN